jgi:hypothetical protein
MAATIPVVEVELPASEPSGSAQHVRRIVVESLERELRLRRDRVPHAQLGVSVDANTVGIRRAYLRLRRQFEPQAYTTHGAPAVALAHEIAALLEAAYLQLGLPLDDDRPLPSLQPARKDETLRALETLRGGIARRKAEALRLKEAGRLAEARRMFEAVRSLDPHDETARTQLRLLRSRPEAPVARLWLAVRGWLSALIHRVVARVQG